MRVQLTRSERLYAALLYLYPETFRTIYGQQMRLTFRDACRLAYHRNGTAGLLTLWLPTLLDLVKSAFEERTRQGELRMSKEKLITFAGPLMIVVGASWIVIFIGSFVLQTWWATYEWLLNLWQFSFYLSFLPLLFALVGTRLRFHQSARAVGRVGLALSAAACAGLVGILLALHLLNLMAPHIGELLWMHDMGFVCLLCMPIGFILFGLDSMRYQVLPRWNLLPLLFGLSPVLSFGAQYGLQFTIMGGSLVLLGIALLHPVQEQEPAPAV